MIAASQTFAESGIVWINRSRLVAVQLPLAASATADLAMIAVGFTSLWAAIETNRRAPQRDGGSIEPSLTEGVVTWLARHFLDGMRTLDRFGFDS